LSNGRVIVFLKAPRPGFVKTRIAAKLDAESAAAIYQALVGMTLSRLAGRTDVELRFAPDDAGAEIGAWRRPGWRIQGQGEGDFGERLERAVVDAFSDGLEKVVLLGTDCPELIGADVDEAWTALEAHDVVIGPALDGGYWLLGLKRPIPELFRNMPWSTDRVSEMTILRSREAGLRVLELRRLRDVDTLEDWRAWQREVSL